VVADTNLLAILATMGKRHLGQYPWSDDELGIGHPAGLGVVAQALAGGGHFRSYLELGAAIRFAGAAVLVAAGDWRWTLSGRWLAAIALDTRVVADSLGERVAVWGAGLVAWLKGGLFMESYRESYIWAGSRVLVFGTP